LEMDLKGLELAARMGQPEQFLPEVEALVTAKTGTDSHGLDSQTYEQAIALFSNLSPDLQAKFQSKLTEPTLRAFALEVLLINQYVPTTQEMKVWLAEPSEEIKTLRRLAQQMVSTDDSTADKSSADDTLSDWPDPLTPTAARIITRVVAYSKNPRLAFLIPEVVLTQTSPDIIRTGLEALLPLASGDDEAIANMASSKLNHYDPSVKIAALELLRVTCCDQHLSAIGHCLADDDPRVRDQAANTLSAYGRLGVDVAKANLSDTRTAVVNAAITAIGGVRSRYASNVLFNYLSPSYALLVETRRWQTEIPTHAPNWEALKIAIEDYHKRLVQKVLFVLSALGHARTVNAVNRLLATNAQAELENAIEVLASLNHRRFVVPLMPLLEALVSPPAGPVAERTVETAVETVGSEMTPEWLKKTGYRLLLEALESSDRWIKSGALIALAMVPATLVDDPDPFVKQVANQIFETTSPTKTAMNRLLLLKTVSLFKNLSLDELMLIDESLEQTQVLSGATIFTEGELTAHLYIIAEGEVQLVKEIDGEVRSLKQLGKGTYFGEVALFDDAPLWDSAIAQTDCTLLKLEKNRFLSLITQRPHIILEICRFLSQRLRETDQYRTEDISNVR
ncbi:MAG: cyclic nucleotide-binding domain-containing protein, partial [Cyanobacteria bacterium J06559_1]